MYGFLLTVAAVLVILGIIALSRRSLALGVGLIVAGFLVGPGGISLFR